MIDTYEVVKKLIGDIEPIGDSDYDRIAFENLKQITDLTESLLKDIGDVARDNKNRHESSMKSSGNFAHTFLLLNGIEDY